MGYIDFPLNMDFIKGTTTFFGWTTDDNGGIQNVEILIDGVFMGFAQYGLTRTDVNEAFPTTRDSMLSGWRFTIDTTQLSDARHRLVVQTLDRAGNRAILGSVDFFVDNP